MTSCLRRIGRWFSHWWTRALPARIGPPTVTAPTTQISVTKDVLLKRAGFFRDVNLWPRAEVLSPERWLENFSEAELPLALSLLHSFQYFSEDLTNELFIAAFHSISAEMWQAHGAAAPSRWRSFFDRVLVTPVEGEQPNPTDSGYIFARRARQQLDIDEARIMRPAAVIAHLIVQSAPVAFVDDFVGSGNQFIETWQRPYGPSQISFAAIAKHRGGDFYYCPMICTEHGAARIQQECPEVSLRPAHLISNRDGALAPDSRIWPDHFRPHALSFVRDTSLRAGIPASGKDSWSGFHGLGLTIAFAHSVPDATLPIFYWEKNGWKPLLRRT
jgi:hypothetical protein